MDKNLFGQEIETEEIQEMTSVSPNFSAKLTEVEMDRLNYIRKSMNITGAQLLRDKINEVWFKVKSQDELF